MVEVLISTLFLIFNNCMFIWSLALRSVWRQTFPDSGLRGLSTTGECPTLFPFLLSLSINIMSFSSLICFSYIKITSPPSVSSSLFFFSNFSVHFYNFSKNFGSFWLFQNILLWTISFPCHHFDLSILSPCQFLPDSTFPFSNLLASFWRDQFPQVLFRNWLIF